MKEIEITLNTGKSMDVYVDDSTDINLARLRQYDVMNVQGCIHMSVVVSDIVSIENKGFISDDKIDVNKYVELYFVHDRISEDDYFKTIKAVGDLNLKEINKRNRIREDITPIVDYKRGTVKYDSKKNIWMEELEKLASKTNSIETKVDIYKYLINRS